MIQEFIQGLHDFHFLQNALITAIVIGVVAGAVGCFIILRGMSLMGDAISHAVLPGVALSYILGINFFIGAITFGLLASIIITYIKGNSIIEESGSLDDMLNKAAEFYEDEVDNSVAQLSSLMEPIIMVVLGSIIGTLLVAMYLPLFNLGNVVG